MPNRAEPMFVGEHLPERQHGIVAVIVVDRLAAERQGRARVEHGVDVGDAAIQGHGHGEHLHHRAGLVEGVGDIVLQGGGTGRARRVGIELGIAGQGQDFAGADIDDDAGPAIGG